ncbi:MAG: prolyl-tRNA synthetase associated domain-containing protein [Clostridia bacterium]|nr:prolyl-tRNA synthetase associated domain-containing protein [Clostridia bacterium]
MITDQTSAIIERLQRLGIEYELYEHAAVEHAADRYDMGLDFGACVCKNLFLTVRNESSFYVMMLKAEKSADLKRIARAIGSSRLCFGSDERLWELMGQRPGMVSPLGIINDLGRRVTVLLDADLRGQKVCVHPSDNTKTLVLDFSNIERYITSFGTKMIFIEP